LPNAKFFLILIEKRENSLKESIKLCAIFPVSAKIIFDAWLDGEQHSEFTGEKAKVLPRTGTSFTAGGGYISGTNLFIQPYGRIVQSWRSKDFPDRSPDSKLELLFEKVEKGTKLTLIHSKIPEGQLKKYEKGWKEHYLKPMKKYFKNHK